MIVYATLRKKPNVLLTLTGLTRCEFDEPLPVLEQQLPNYDQLDRLVAAFLLGIVAIAHTHQTIAVLLDESFVPFCPGNRVNRVRITDLATVVFAS